MSWAGSSYLILLEGILSNPKSIQVAANLSELPQAITAISETRDAVFCRIDGNSKQSIEKLLSQQKSTFNPTCVRLFKAMKDLSANSIYPNPGMDSTQPQHRLSSGLSLDTTLPQHRVSSSHTAFSPRQDEYTVWYFFYGTLADTVLLNPPSLVGSRTSYLDAGEHSGGLIKWHGKCKALWDSTDIVHGSAYKVTSREREEDLLLYEMEKYEVTRCCITNGEPNSSTAHISIRRFFVTPKKGPRVSGLVLTARYYDICPLPLIHLIRLKRTSERDLDLHHHHTSIWTFICTCVEESLLARRSLVPYENLSRGLSRDNHF